MSTSESPIHDYNRLGVEEPPAIALMRQWLQDRGYPFTVRGIHVDTRAELTLSLPRGDIHALKYSYGVIEDLLNAKVVRPSGYPAQTDKALKVRSPWDAPHMAPMFQISWSNGREGLNPKFNDRAHGLIVPPQRPHPVAQLVVHSDAPRLDVIHGPTGFSMSVLLTWIALRNGLENGNDVVTAAFEALADAVEMTGMDFSMKHVFGQVGYGARMGFGLRADGAEWLLGVEKMDDPVDPLFRNFEATISAVSEYPEDSKHTVDTRPFALDLARLAYLQVRSVEVRGTQVPARQMIFVETCTLTGRDPNGELINASKRRTDAALGKGVHTGETATAAELFSSAGGFAVYPM